ncbi:MAG: hypothetical protein WC516_10060 [Patescibacteria group bacterium]|jgi:hypothetical protein
MKKIPLKMWAWIIDLVIYGCSVFVIYAVFFMVESLFSVAIPSNIRLFIAVGILFVSFWVILDGYSYTLGEKIMKINNTSEKLNISKPCLIDKFNNFGWGLLWFSIFTGLILLSFVFFWGIAKESKLMGITLFLLMSVLSSVTFWGCHIITLYGEREQFINKPLIMHQKPWIGTIAGIFSVIVFLSLFVNGWFIARWLGMVALPIFWFIINPRVSSLLKWDKGKHLLIRNPFILALFGGIGLVILTLANIIIR